MKTLQTHLDNPFILTQLSPKQSHDKRNVWDNSFLKKFVTTKWPFEIYRGSIFQDFWTVLSSK